MPTTRGSRPVSTGRSARRREFLVPLLVAALLVALIGTFTAFGFGLISPARLGIDLVITFLIGVLPLGLVLLGRVNLGVGISLSMTFVAIAWLAATGGGISSHWSIYQLLYVTMASFLVSRRSAFLLAAAVIAVDAAIVFAANRDLLPPAQVRQTPLYTLLVLSMGSFFAVFLITRFVASLERALEGTRTELASRKAAEAELTRSHHEYEQLVSLVPGVVFKFRANADGSYDLPFVSDGIERLAGISAADVTADPARLFDAALPDARSGLLASIDAAVTNRASWHYEIPVKSPYGTVRWVRGQSVPTGFDADGRPVWHGVLLDVTERRRTEEELRDSEERFRTLAASIPEVFWIADVPGNFTYVSPAVSRVWGFEPGDVLADGGLWYDSVHPEDKHRVMERFRSWAASSTDPPYRESYRIVRVDGAVRWVEALVTLRQRLGDGRVRVGGVVTDVTERRQGELDTRAAEHLSHQRQKLEALGTLAGGIAHDFNNMLSVIQGHAELALAKVPEAAEYLEPMTVAGRRARDLVRRILLFSRPTTEERVPVCLGQVVTEAVGLLRSTLPRSIEVSWTPPPAGALVIGDPSQLSQALMNLGVNAGHSIPGAAGRIELTLSSAEVDDEDARRRQIAAGPYVVLAVRDNGSGMEPAVVDRIFEPFFTTKPVGEGTGLGLAVVHSIVHNHGGTIAVESAPGLGTTFTLWLPLAPAGPAGARLAGARVAAAGGVGQGREIMVVEDQVEVLGTVCAMLRHLGFSPTGFAAPIEAVRAFGADAGRFAAVLSDRSMPDMNGLDVARAVRSARPGVPFILMTGFEGGLGPDLLAEAGVTAVLPKPAGLQDLAEVFRRHLDQSDQQA